MHSDPGTTDQSTGARLVEGDHSHYGYVTLTVNADTISGHVTLVDKDGTVVKPSDSFSYSAHAQSLPENVTVSL
jgi:hypothetical protein